MHRLLIIEANTVSEETTALALGDQDEFVNKVDK